MGDCWKTIKGEDHVLSLNDYNTLKVSKYRNEIQEQFQAIAQNLLSHSTKQIALAKLAQSQTVLMQFQHINWICCPQEDIDCEILFLGEDTWQKGKLRIQVSIDFPENMSSLNVKNAVFIEGLSDPNSVPEINFVINVLLEFLSAETIEASEENNENALDWNTYNPEDDSITSPHLFTFKSNS
jgi:KGK domain